MKVKIRKDIKEKPTEHEKTCILSFGQDMKNKCLDCGIPLYYFNQCDDCYSKMINIAKVTTC